MEAKKKVRKGRSFKTPTLLSLDFPLNHFKMLNGKNPIASKVKNNR